MKLTLSNCADLAVWNDAPERTQEEVVQALLKAAQLAEKDGK